MQFLKKHYEKVLLGLVLLGLVGALVFMLFYIANDKQAMETNANIMINPAVKPLPGLDLTAHNAALARLQAPFVLDFDTGNKVFNAGEWKKLPDGQMVRQEVLGVRAAAVTKINPLYLTITLKSVMTNELGVRYTLEVDRQTNSVAAKRKRSYYISENDKPNDFFALQKVGGAPDNPDVLSLTLKLVDSGDIVTVTRDERFQRVEGYMADLRYAPENRIFSARRVGDKITFGGTDYIVLEVSKNSVVLSDQSNQKKTTLSLAP